MRKIGNLRKIVSENQSDVSTVVDPIRKSINSVWKSENGLLTKQDNNVSAYTTQIENNGAESVTLPNPPQPDNSLLREYLDFNFSYVAPFENSENNGFSATSMTSKFNVKPNHKFSFNLYDSFSSNVREETFLIDYQTFLYKNLIRTNTEESLTIKKILTFGDVYPSIKQIDKIASLKDIKRYLTDYSNFLSYQTASIDELRTFFSTRPDNLASELIYDSRRSVYRNIIFEGEAFKQINQASVGNPPLLNNINITLTKETIKDFLLSFKEAKLDLFLLKEVYKSFQAFSQQTIQKESVLLNSINLSIQEENTLINSFLGNRINADSSIKPSIRTIELKYFNVNDYINTLYNSTTGSQLFYTYGNTSDNEATLSQQGSTTVSTPINARPLIVAQPFSMTQEAIKYSTQALALRLDQIIKKYHRSYSDILSGKECYSEIIAYAIEKRDGDNNTFKQRIIIENNDSELLSYFDTQISKDKKYKYELKYYVAVLANRYKYVLSTGVPSNPQRKFTIDNKPEILIFEVPANPINSNSLEVFTPIKGPPAAPIVTPIPYKDVGNKIKFNFIKNTDSYKAPYIIIQDVDGENLTKLWQAQDITGSLRDLSTPILFRSEVNSSTSQYPEAQDTIDISIKEKYEIFKTTTPPKFYSDFKNKLVKTTSNTSFLDEEIEPNTKYYYTFRAVNSEGIASNPTHILEIELVNNSGGVFPVIKPYEFDDSSYTDQNKDFNKYLYISPAYLQTLIKLSNPQQINTATTSVLLGPEKNNVWNKKFKIRMTSKQTGRKIDINFTMKYGPKIS